MIGNRSSSTIKKTEISSLQPVTVPVKTSMKKPDENNDDFSVCARPQNIPPNLRARYEQTECPPEPFMDRKYRTTFSIYETFCAIARVPKFTCVVLNAAISPLPTPPRGVVYEEDDKRPLLGLAQVSLDHYEETMFTKPYVREYVGMRVHSLAGGCSGQVASRTEYFATGCWAGPDCAFNGFLQGALRGDARCWV